MNNPNEKPTSSDIIAGYGNVAVTYGRYPVAIERGEGSLLWDFDGKRYIDMGSGIATNTFGFSDGEWISSVTAQLAQVQHTSNYYYTAPQAKLAAVLCERTGMSSVFFSNSGAEANECAIKTARKYSSDKYGAGRNRIITLKNGFHGRTLTTISATGQEVFHKHFDPFTPGFIHAEPNNWDEIKGLITTIYKGAVCAVMIELIQGESGVNVLEPGYVKKLAALAAERDILLIIDEVQTGNGRTGELYCFQDKRWGGLEPDIVSTAKGLGGGLPIGATLFGEKTAATLTPGTHGSTFGGNPVCAAGACNIIERLDDAMLAGVRERGEYIRDRLEKSGKINGYSGMGLIWGVETRRPVADIINDGIAAGVLMMSAKTKLRLLPALNIPMKLLEEAMDILVELL